uniref:Zinc transporter ZIP9 n=1 Tax=Latimeria chalumnae TaxID=7897 RepID=H3A5S6_LATCH
MLLSYFKCYLSFILIFKFMNELNCHIFLHFQQKLQFVSVLGAGLLCGTALAVIIPEGIELLEDSSRVKYRKPAVEEKLLPSYKHSVVSAINYKNIYLFLYIYIYIYIYKKVSLYVGFMLLSHVKIADILEFFLAVTKTIKSSCADLSIAVEAVLVQCSNLSESRLSQEASAEESPSVSSHFIIGVSLVVGFILMFAVDQISSYCCYHVCVRMHIYISITATLGLVIHAAADGVALGAAVASSQVTIQIIVFLAIILHKAPAAFGLVSFLMHAGFEKRQIQKHLFAFSIAAPLLAVITYFILVYV